MRIYLILLFMFLGHLLLAQSNSRLNLAPSYGFILPHAAELMPFADNRPHGISLEYQLMGLSNKKWSSCNCFHYLGLKLSHYNFRERDVLGTATSLSGTFEPIIWTNQQWTFSMLSGIGFSYLDRIYDEESNPTNVFFSSKLSFLLFVTPRLEFLIQDNFGVNLSLSYNHISNGGQKQPNKGINFPMLGLGVSYYLSTSELPEFSSNETSREWLFYLESGITTRQSTEQTPRRPAFALVAGALKPISKINGIGTGVELNKDFSLPVENSRLEALMPAPFIAHHFLLGRFDFSQRMSVYTFKPIGYMDNFFYQRYTLKYSVYQNLSAGFSLKAHGHVAENIDFRLSWVF